ATWLVVSSRAMWIVLFATRCPTVQMSDTPARTTRAARRISVSSAATTTRTTAYTTRDRIHTCWMATALTPVIAPSSRRPPAPAAAGGPPGASARGVALASMGRTVSRRSRATSFVVCSSQIGWVLARIASAAARARRAWDAMLSAVSQMVTSSAAATAMTTAAIAIQKPQAAQRSASVIGALPRRAPVEVVAPDARAVAAPEAIPLGGRAAGLLRSLGLPHVVEELHHPIGGGLRRHPGPPARHLPEDVPAMLAIVRAVRQPPQPADDAADALGGERRDDRAGRRLGERAELVRKGGHRAADAHAAGAHTAAHVVDGAALDDVAVDDWPPASDLDQALGVAVALGEETLLVETGPRAALVDGVAEEPRRAPEVVEGGQGPQALQEQQHREHRLGEVVALGRAPRDVDDGQADRAPVVPAEEVHPAHGAGRVALRRRDAAPRRARADGDGRRRPRRQPPEPRRGRHRLGAPAARRGLHAHGAEVAAGPRGDALVRHRSLEDHHVGRPQLALPGLGERAHELRAGLGGQHRVVQDDLRHRGHRAGEQPLDAGVGGPGHRDGAPVAAHAGQPVDVNRLDRTEREPLPAGLRLHLGNSGPLDLDHLALDHRHG